MTEERNREVEQQWTNRMERMCFRFLAEIPLPFIIRFFEEKLGGKVILNAADQPAQHCPACAGSQSVDDGDTTPCPGVEL